MPGVKPGMARHPVLLPLGTPCCMIKELSVKNPLQAASHPTQVQYRIHISDDLNDCKPEYDAPPVLDARINHGRDKQHCRPKMACLRALDLSLHLRRIAGIALQIYQRLQNAELYMASC